MIRYSLRCENEHEFDSWFQSVAASDALLQAGRVECPNCGSSNIDKGLMAPNVAKRGDLEGGAAQPTAMMTGADPDRARFERAVRKIKAEVERNSDYVGDKFATEARRMHLGDAPVRSIHGEARPEEARSLIEDGVPVLPLPFIPTKKTN
jgi:hypothetical protein